MVKTTNSSTNTGGSNVSTDIANDPLLSKVQESLLKQSEAISSTDSEIEKTISNAIGGVKSANQASRERIASEYDRNVGYAYDAAKVDVTTANEARRGFATNTGILKLLAENTEKSVRDMDQRKNELILQGDAEAASTIAGLQMKALEFKQQKEQQVFENLLSLSNFGLSFQQEKRAQLADKFNRDQAIGGIALQFGLEVNPGETLDSIITRAKPLASQEYQLKLSKAQKEATEMDLQIQKLRNGLAPKSESDIDMLAKTAFFDKESVFSRIEDADTIAKITTKMAEKEGDLLVKPLVMNSIASGDSLDTIIEGIRGSSQIQNKEVAIAQAKSIYNSTSPKEAKGYSLGDKTGSPFMDLLYGAGYSIEQAGSKTAEFFTGKKPKGVFNY